MPSHFTENNADPGPFDRAGDSVPNKELTDTHTNKAIVFREGRRQSVFHE